MAMDPNYVEDDSCPHQPDDACATCGHCPCWSHFGCNADNDVDFLTATDFFTRREIFMVFK